ncbi:ABC transporter substrate-binding protein [Paenibacillus allorhizosphaerae]|uniref:Extracellular solute-binding protein n=1 Tax=Paenibacillus allorhizosphaerae TaxID=2849866 RepID=A0ABM8VG40_9BACL|nr:extracellular solute-binding protein [Paenibacillus allorhizosphaerae]CAG7636973.1 hypothetical protein PAECIP111802_02307 [Paenibacillus allorhizosphaerae]
MNQKNGWIMAAILLTLSMTAGCSSSQAAVEKGTGGKGAEGTNKENSGPPAVSTEPVTLNILASAYQVDFETMLIDPVKKKYPNITLNVMATGTGKNIQDLVAAGNTPDLFAGYTGMMPALKQLDVLDNLEPLVKKFRVDLDRYEPAVIDAIKVSGNNNELSGLPFNLQLNALYYNKDIFDRFGVPYPKDGMTWDDAIELARKLTRTEGGVAYRGLDPESFTRIFYPRSVNIVDPKTNKAAVNNEQWKTVFDLGKRILSIPGNERKESSPINEFRKSKTLAMLPSYNFFSDMKEASESGLNWDVAQYPSYKDRPNIYGMVDPWIMFVAKTSKHKDAAMQVLEVLTSNEVMLQMAKNTAKLPPLKNPEMKKALGENMPFLKGKSIVSVFKSRPAPNPSFTKYDTEAQKWLEASFWDYIRDKKDINTALRDAEEQINQIIREY